jgi:hypothetical protein
LCDTIKNSVLSITVGPKGSRARPGALPESGPEWEIDNSLTFGGTHYFEQHQIYGEVRCRSFLTTKAWDTFYGKSLMKSFIC